MLHLKIACGQTVGTACLFLFLEFDRVKTRSVVDVSPILFRSIQLKAGSEAAVQTDNHGYPSRLTRPGGHPAANEQLHGPEVLDGVDHRVLPTFFNKPVEQFIHGLDLLLSNPGPVLFMPEILIIYQWLLIDVVIGTDSVFVGQSGQFFDILNILGSDVDVEERDIAVDLFLLNQLFELSLDPVEIFGNSIVAVQ